MDVMKLEAGYYPGPLVEGYTSMIWTERFNDAGDFQMVTPKIQETKALIPEGSLITLRDSNEVMLVETHDISVDTQQGEDGIPELTITGRTLETVLEKRVAIGTYGQPWTAYKQYTTAQFAALLLWTYLVDLSGQDPSRVGGTHDVDDAIAGFLVAESSTVAEAVKEWSLQEGVVYQQLRDALKLGRLGVRGFRPPYNPALLAEFDISGGTTRGDISEASMGGIPSIGLEVYNGLDRTRFQTDREPVIFHYESGHIDNPKYLFSIKDFYNVALVRSSLGVTEVWPETGTTPPSTPPTGLDRRVLDVDGGQQGDTPLDEFTASVIQKGQTELAKHRYMTLFDGGISPVSPYVYGRDYFLGDDVTLLAQYGFEAEMTVAEYVRTEDQEGDRGYPTLVLSSQEE